MLWPHNAQRCPALVKLGRCHLLICDYRPDQQPDRKRPTDDLHNSRVNRSRKNNEERNTHHGNGECIAPSVTDSVIRKCNAPQIWYGNCQNKHATPRGYNPGPDDPAWRRGWPFRCAFHCRCNRKNAAELVGESVSRKLLLTVTILFVSGVQSAPAATAPDVSRK